MSGALERLKAIAEAKRKAEQEKVNDNSAVPDSSDSPSSSSNLPDGSVENVDCTSDASSTNGISIDSQDTGVTVQSPLEQTATTDSILDSPSVDSISSGSGLSSDNPIKMQLAELEAALTQKIPEFRTILRDIHGKLRQDPELVTAMSEEEISLIVSGLVAHANVEVLAPKAAKKAKSLGTAKNPIGADDL